MSLFSLRLYTYQEVVKSNTQKNQAGSGSEQELGL